MPSCFSCVWLSVTPWTVARQTPLPMGFSRQEYWSGLPCPPSKGPSWPRDWTCVSYGLPALAGGVFTTSTTWIPTYINSIITMKNIILLSLQWINCGSERLSCPSPLDTKLAGGGGGGLWSQSGCHTVSGECKKPFKLLQVENTLNDVKFWQSVMNHVAMSKKVEGLHFQSPVCSLLVWILGDDCPGV